MYSRDQIIPKDHLVSVFSFFRLKNKRICKFLWFSSYTLHFYVEHRKKVKYFKLYLNYCIELLNNSNVWTYEFLKPPSFSSWHFWWNNSVFALDPKRNRFRWHLSGQVLYIHIRMVEPERTWNRASCIRKTALQQIFLFTLDSIHESPTHQSVVWSLRKTSI